MERIHPNVSFAATCALFALALGLTGCRSSSSGIAGSPFMSPDRVPPPNTRAIQPGQAQPYYQGDPLPAMQSGATSPSPAIAALPSDVETRTASGRTLAWTQPGPTAPTPNPANAAPAAAVAPVSPQQPQATAIANENSVAVPNDADPLRFPLPAPTAPEPAAAPIASAVPIPTQPQAVQPAPVQQVPSVQQASYNAPIPSAPLLPSSPSGISTPQQLAKPWRAPQIVQATQTPTYAPQPVPGQQYVATAPTLPAPPAVQANTVGVTLRAVESPAQPGDPIPRVRVPGYIASQTSADGFRPRTSMQ